ncbi:MAG: hypothetical protein WCC48_17250 [Anaeromyxobacteraceae bacterium]
MSRFASLRALTAAVILALVLPAAAAEATRVASSGDEDNPFDLDFTIKAEYLQQRALITREYTQNYPSGALPSVEERPELRYARRTFSILPRVAVGLYKDLELHIEVPVILSSNTNWHYAFSDGQPQNDATSATGNDGVFPGQGTVYHGSGFGDVKLGLAWGILSDARDDTKPLWLVGIDFIIPTAKMYDPGAGRLAPVNQTSPSYDNAGAASPTGENVLKIDLVTALSKRMGPADPYVRFHVTSYRPSDKTYSNCNHPVLLDAPCNVPSGSAKYGARPPWITGAAFGTEIVTGENKAEGTRVAIDLRLTGDYVSSSRWYNELTDMTGKLLRTEDYFELDAFFGFYWRASKYMQLQATAHLGTETPHFITGETVGDPNYNSKYDAAGSRYRLTEVSNFGLALAGVLQF